ncbi:MAG TPA: BrnT family toxin [Rhizobiaceae bacterium]|nr:BrnT family toxin [Rhizobiaceae bacterium]
MASLRLTIVEWDEGNWPKCGQHGLLKEEIEEFLGTRPSIWRDPHGQEERLRAVGSNAAGRYVFVVFTLRRQGEFTYIRPISARYMHHKEVLRYEQDSPEAISRLSH